MEQKRGEGHKDLKKGVKAGSRGGFLKKRGGLELCIYIYHVCVCVCVCVCV